MALKIMKSKKAIFFTLISILIVTLFIIYMRIQIDIPMKEKVSVVESRITSMNDFVKSFENVYAPRALYAISHNALHSITIYLNETNKDRLQDQKFFIRDISESFQMAVNESKIIGLGNEKVNLPGLENMQYWLEQLANKTSEEIGVEFNFSIYSIRLEQDYETGPWRVRAVMEMAYSINSSSIAQWDRQPSQIGLITTEFDVDGFIDPYIAVMSDGILIRRINISSTTPRQISNLLDFRKILQTESYVFENYTAPSFLARFEGDTSVSHCCGIESFVWPSLVEDAPILDEDVYGQSYLDFQYWSGRCYDEKSLSQDNTLWNLTEIYDEYDFIKVDSYHRFMIYPNIDARYREADYGDITGGRCDYSP
ncbi:hypothetical protein ACFL6I_07970 [candidate division KSB1 bacterium]